MASSRVDNVIDLGRVRDLRRQRNARVEVNWLTFTPMIGFVMWFGLILGSVWVWEHVI